MEKTEQITNTEEIWNAAAEQIRRSMDRQTIASLLETAEYLDHVNDTYVICVKNAYTQAWLEQRLTQTIEKILSGMHPTEQHVSFVVKGSQAEANFHALKEVNSEAKPESETSRETIFHQEEKSSVQAVLANNQPTAKRISVIHPKYTFDNFVIGPCNNLAAAACRTVAEIPSASYNPLFIYSGVGLGKTHLLHAIGNRMQQQGRNILYTTSEDFTNDYIYSLQRHENKAFREKYRNVDTLLIDDIQFIIGKESTQEEFFHTFNKLYQMDKQIVITSDRSPRLMTTLDERMRSRFEWGLTVDIQPPDFETRLAILNMKVQQAKRKVPRDILELIAHQIPDNIRELEGALTRVLAYADLCGRTLDRDLVLMSLTDMVPVTPKVQTNDIVSVVSEVFGVPEEKIMSRERTRDVALSRQVVMYLMREEGNSSLPQIGKALGGRDHSTVIHACDKVARLLETDNHFRKMVFQVKDQLY